MRGNIVRNVRARIAGAAPETEGFGIGVEADTAVTGNVIENAETAGIVAGWGEYLRDVAITGNVVRDARHRHRGVGRGRRRRRRRSPATCLPAVKRGAIVGMDWRKPVTGDLALAGAERYPLAAHHRQSGELKRFATIQPRWPRHIIACHVAPSPPSPPQNHHACHRRSFSLRPSLRAPRCSRPSDAPRSWRDADWSSTGLLPQRRRLQAGARGRVHRQGRRLEGRVRGAQLGRAQARERRAIGPATTWSAGASRCAPMAGRPDGRWYGNVPVGDRRCLGRARPSS